MTDSHRFCVAPMIDWTDRYCRVFHRQLSGRARLYTEMIVDQAIVNGDRDHLLGFDQEECPVALQLGGSDPDTLAAAAEVGAARGYDEINLNVGCPSDRVQSGVFGACLMRTPDRVAEAVAAMSRAVAPIPVTVKCRIGVDDQDPEVVLPDFVSAVIEVGAGTVIVHARKAWLNGLSPKENRTIPPLDYGLVRRVAANHPQTAFVLNGGIRDLDAVDTHLTQFEGVMVGRAAYEQPWILREVDHRLFGAPPSRQSRADVVRSTIAHFTGRGVPIWRYARHMLGLFHGAPGARLWRRRLTEDARGPMASEAWLADLAEEIEALGATSISSFG